MQQALEPMSPPDRKVVHDTVNEIDGVSHVSEGEEPRRRVVIIAGRAVEQRRFRSARGSADAEALRAAGELRARGRWACSGPVPSRPTSSTPRGSSTLLADGGPVRGPRQRRRHPGLVLAHRRPEPWSLIDAGRDGCRFLSEAVERPRLWASVVTVTAEAAEDWPAAGARRGGRSSARGFGPPP